MFGKKNNNSSHTHYVYTVYDSVSRKHRGLFYHSNDEEMIRTSLPTILMDYPLRDIEIRRIGTFNEDTGIVSESNITIIPTNCYTFPHSRLSSDGDNLSLEELEKGMKDFKADMISKLSEKKEEKSEVVNG